MLGNILFTLLTLRTSNSEGAQENARKTMDRAIRLFRVYSVACILFFLMRPFLCFFGVIPFAVTIVFLVLPFHLVIAPTLLCLQCTTCAIVPMKTYSHQRIA